MFGALLDGRTLTRVPFIISIFWCTTSYSWQSQYGEMEEFFNQISLNLDQSNFTLAKDACLMLGSQKSLIHDEFGKKWLTSFSKRTPLATPFCGQAKLVRLPRYLNFLLLIKNILLLNFYQLTSIEDNDGGAASSSAPVMILVWQTLSLMKHCSWANLISNISR